MIIDIILGLTGASVFYAGFKTGNNFKTMKGATQTGINILFK